LKLSLPCFEENGGEEIRHFLQVLARKIGNMKSLQILDLSDCTYEQFCLPNLEVFKMEVIDYFDSFKKSLKTAVVIGGISDFYINEFLISHSLKRWSSFSA
jgi:hypothetical protein